MEAPVPTTTRTKKFIAPTLRQALDAMRRELGDDALLLATRSGVDTDGMPFAEVVGMAASRQAFTTTILTDAAGAASPPSRVRGHSPGEPVPLRYYIERGATPSTEQRAIAQLQEDIHRLSAKLTEITHAVAYRYSAILPDPYRQIYEMLRNAGFAEHHAGFLVAHIANGQQPTTTEECIERLRTTLAELLPIEPIFATSVPSIIAFSGPSGSGKTTTLMKVALSLQKVYPEHRITLVATDTERIAANEQLRSLATIVGLNLITARTQSDLAVLPNDGIALVDLPPPSGRSSIQSATLADATVAAGGVVICTLPATTDRDIARSLLQQAATNEQYRIALTKLDEAPQCGHLLPLFWECNVPLSLMTTGTRLPDDLVEPSIDHLMQFLFSAPQNRYHFARGQ
ncbi:Flagellar biosynthesis protein FlhF [bacterium HR20]|nr:Flagellar biosynthesis protein FlhF [bacterium HR20]